MESLESLEAWWMGLYGVIGPLFMDFILFLFKKKKEEGEGATNERLS